MVKKILIAANSDLRYDRRLGRIAISLRSGGYETTLIGRAFAGTSPEKREKERHLNLWIQKGKLAYLELNIRLFFALIVHKADAICSVDLDTLPACRLAALIMRCKLVQDSHEYMAEVPEVTGRPITKAVWHQIARWFLPACHLRYTTSQGLVDEFRKVYNSEFGLIRNMPLLQEIPDAEPMPDGFPQQDFLVYLGAVNRGRGLEEILEAIAERTENLVIVGDGDKSTEIQRLIRKFQLENRVFLTGKLLPSSLFHVLGHARAGLNLLRDEGLSYRFSLANKFFDYVHAGIPQLCIDFPEYRNLIHQFEVGILCDLDCKSIQDGLDKLSDQQLVSQMRSRALEARQVWNWQKEESELLRLYHGLFF